MKEGIIESIVKIPYKGFTGYYRGVSKSDNEYIFEFDDFGEPAEIRVPNGCVETSGAIAACPIGSKVSFQHWDNGVSVFTYNDKNQLFYRHTMYEIDGVKPFAVAYKEGIDYLSLLEKNKKLVIKYVDKQCNKKDKQCRK